MTETVADLSVGTIHPTKRCGDVLIQKYNRIDDITIVFKNTGTVLEKVSGSNLRKGLVLDPYYPTLYNVGYLGIGDYHYKHNRDAYWKWVSMLNRVYRPDAKTQKNYFDCSVVDEWHNFQNFAKWYYDQPFQGKRNYELDKDLLVENNRTYGPKFCCLIPSILNISIAFITTSKCCLGVHREGNKFIAETRMKSSLIRRIGSYDTQEEARLRYLDYRWYHILILSENLYEREMITNKQFEMVKLRQVTARDNLKKLRERI